MDGLCVELRLEVVRQADMHVGVGVGVFFISLFFGRSSIIF